jgi:hypothetical protein
MILATLLNALASVGLAEGVVGVLNVGVGVGLIYEGRRITKLEEAIKEADGKAERRHERLMDVLLERKS